MSTWRGLAIVLLASCASPAAPKPQPVSASAAPVATPAPPAAPPAATEVSDPVCHQLAADSEPDTDSGGDASQASTDDDAPATDDGPSPRRKKRERITACSVARPNISREAAAILAAKGHARPLPPAPWNHRTAPERLDVIRRRFELAPDELAQLTRTGVVVPARLDQYSAWYAAIRALATVPTGALPSFATTDAGADLRFNTMAAAYGQLKHNYVLMAGQPYSEFGCEIPDGYVEPVPAAYDALIEYATRGGKVAALIDPQDKTGAKAHFSRVADTLRVIRKIADDELANRPLTTREKRWLGMVSELSVDTSQDITGYPPVYSGWYFDLFLDAEADGMRGASYIADYFTSVEDGISYAGATAPRMGIFVVDTGGAPRAFVGPVARAFETHTPLATRLTDDSPLPSIEDPWAASYTIAAHGTRPQLALRYDPETGDVIVKSAGALGPATIKLLDHHRVPLATRTQAIAGGETVFAFHRKSKGKSNVGAVYVSIGAFRDWVVGDSYGQISDQWGKLPDGDE